MVVNYNLLPSVETQVKVTAENNYIRLIPGFVANATSTFQASIEPCGALPNPYKEVQKKKGKTKIRNDEVPALKPRDLKLKKSGHTDPEPKK